MGDLQAVRADYGLQSAQSTSSAIKSCVVTKVCELRGRCKGRSSSDSLREERSHGGFSAPLSKAATYVVLSRNVPPIWLHAKCGRPQLWVLRHWGGAANVVLRPRKNQWSSSSLPRVCRRTALSADPQRRASHRVYVGDRRVDRDGGFPYVPRRLLNVKLEICGSDPQSARSKNLPQVRQQPRVL